MRGQRCSNKSKRLALCTGRRILAQRDCSFPFVLCWLLFGGAMIGSVRGRTPLFSKFRAGIPMICTDPPSNDCFAVLKLDPANVKRVLKLSFFSQTGGQQNVFAHIPCLCQAGNIGGRWLRTWRTHFDYPVRNRWVLV